MKTNSKFQIRPWNPFKQSVVLQTCALALCFAVPNGQAQTNRAAGGVVAWGWNDYGQTDVPMNLADVIAVAGGYDHSLALKADGTVVAWGGNGWGQASVPVGLSNIIAVAAGTRYSLALKADGTVVAWGISRNGVLDVPAGLAGVTAISAGESHCLALQADGEVVAWGINADGQTNVPIGLAGVIAIAAGTRHSLALKADGTVVAWGNNNYGQVNVPQDLSGVTAISTGYSHNLALKSNGTVVAWGWNFYGQASVPAGLTGVVAVAAGAEYSLALKSNGGIIAWGYNAEGQTNLPLGLKRVAAIAAGCSHSLAIVLSPTLRSQPESKVAGVDDSVLLSVGVIGASPLAYQWYFNSTNLIDGATNSGLMLTNLQVSQSGSYLAVVTNAYGAVTSAPAALEVLPWTGVVTEPGESDLRVQLSRGGRVTFACDGTIIVSNTIAIEQDTVLDGTGHQITISGGDAVRVFYNSTNTSLSLLNLTIANGRCTNGAGIFNDGGTVSLLNVSLETNNAYVQECCMMGAEGGGIFNRGGTVNATNCSFYCNAALPPPQYPGTPYEARGGAIRNESGVARLKSCAFVGNSACGGVVPPSASSLYWGADGVGGAIHNGGTLIALDCQFSGNSVSGGPGASSGVSWFDWSNSGGSGKGGAAFNSGVMQLDACSFSQNSGFGATGGSAWIGPASRGGWGRGGGICNTGSLVVINSTFVSNTVYGAAGGNAGLGFDERTHSAPGGAVGGSGSGGGICSLGSLFVEGSTFAGNLATGAGGGRGGDGRSGDLYGDGGTTGGAGGPGGSGYGGALFNSGTASLVNSTFASNVGSGSTGGEGGTGGPTPTTSDISSGGSGGSGGLGGSGYGGIYDANGFVTITDCTVSYNVGTSGQGGAGGQGGSGYYPGIPGDPGTNGIAAGGIGALGSLVVNTILAGNSPSNCSGTITDAGHNLSSDNSCAFTSAGSLNNVDPMLGPLADYGGPTLTMTLLPGSPAIDAGDDAAAPSSDQRGFLRPVGAASDIGACEGNPANIVWLSPTQTAEQESSVDFALGTTGDPAMAYLWFFNETNLVAYGTNADLVLTNLQLSESGVYTVIVTNVFGAVTSAPITLSVIPRVERTPVPGINMVGEVGSLLNVDYADSLSPSVNWLALDTVSLVSTPQFYFDLTSPLPAQRFYRVWQTGTPSVIPSMELHFVPAIALTGSIGDTLRLDYINAIGPTDAWVALDTVTLTNTSQLYFDTSSIGQPRRLYRIVPEP